MKKPFYSKRRLKKMGVNIIAHRNELEINILSFGGSLHQSENIIKMIKASEKTVRVNVDSLICSCASLICSDMDRVAKRLTDYKYYPEQMFTAIPNKMFFP